MTPDDDRARPLLLRADNFTPPQRTPWGGTRLLRTLKTGAPISPERLAYSCVGESWELSVEPDFPSVVDAAPGEPSARTLASVMAEDPYAFVGREALRGHRGTALLVKLLDTADALSVQIHPADDYAGLAPDEAGKPESWYVVAREPGAGLYLGLSEGVTRESLAAALAAGADLTPMLAFVPVEPGDFFLIEAGTPHAIGPGLVLVEPQYVTPGKRGVTYRYWDWNRRYDAQGRADPAGSPRALHVAAALAVTNWDAPRGEAFAASVRVRAGTPDIQGPARLDRLSGRAGALPSPWLDVARLTGTGTLDWPAPGALVGLTVLAGTVTVIEPRGRRTPVAAGRTAALPACIGDVRLELADAHAVLASIP
jgi:hypothetical protein